MRDHGQELDEAFEAAKTATGPNPFGKYSMFSMAASCTLAIVQAIDRVKDAIRETNRMR